MNDDLPYITPEEIEAQYAAILSVHPDTTPEETATHMVRWAEAIVRVGISRKQMRIDALENVLYTIGDYVRDAKP